MLKHRNENIGAIRYTEEHRKAFKRIEKVILGHNTGSDLTDNNYNSVVRKWNPNGITLYTCVNGWRNVRIAFFEPKWCDEIIDKINPSGYTYK